jgi:hypothetical protein
MIPETQLDSGYQAAAADERYGCCAEYPPRSGPGRSC